ncbi:MAG: tetraacyldisaccharide 4'-kinase [Deltaproteobacteria bacterium]|nr:tetraacyldisaccharide 4'-kinase [Deltaproteobacteria bacterium]
MERPHPHPWFVLAALARAADFVARRRRSVLPRATGAQLPTLAVHGLALGGAGKTPACLWLAERLARRTGGRVAVGTRPRAVVADEIELYRRRLPAAAVFPEERPARAVERAESAGCAAIVLDDPSLAHAAPAHFRLVCLGPGDDWRAPIFPAGDRRPGCVRPGEADHLLLVGRSDAPAGVALRSARASVEVVGFVPADTWPAGEPRRPPPGRPPVFVLCAVARAERVVRTVEACGCRVAGADLRRDHSPLSRAVLERAARAARAVGAKWVVLTEKDAARCGAAPPVAAPGGPAWMVVRVGLRVDGGDELVERFLRSAGS